MSFSASNLFLSFICSNVQETIPRLDDPYQEHNAARNIRPIIRKCRKVKGKTGWALRRYGHHFGADISNPEAVGHHALQIGQYVYEVMREKYVVGHRSHVDETWTSTVGERVIGFTDLSDAEIQAAALKAEAFCKRNNGGRYHIKLNNCQTFTDTLLRFITTSEYDDRVASIASKRSTKFKPIVTLDSLVAPYECSTGVTGSGDKADGQVTKTTTFTITVQKVQWRA